MSTKIMLLSTMPCPREPFNSSVRPARKPAVFAALFQPLEAAKRAKRLYFHIVSKTCVAPRGSYSVALLSQTLLIASFALRLVPWEVRYRLKVPVERHSLPPASFPFSHVSVCMPCVLQNLFIFDGRHPSTKNAKFCTARKFSAIG